MADKTIGSLPQAPVLTDDSSFVCEDSGVAKRVTGRQFKDFAKEGAAPAVEAAESAAERAEAATVNAPKIQDGTWWTFDQDTQTYVDTGVDANGHTPQRGVDYWTAEDQQAIVNATIAALPNGDEVSY